MRTIQQCLCPSISSYIYHLVLELNRRLTFLSLRFLKQMHHARIVVDFFVRWTKCSIDLVYLSWMYSELGFHTDSFEIIELFLQSFRVLKLNIWCINRDNVVSVAAQSKPFASKV